MEISSVDFDSSPPLQEDSLLEDWERVGEVALDVFLIIATGALIPSLFKRKRTYAPVLPASPSPVEVVEVVEVVEAGAIPAPQCTPRERENVEKILKTTAAGGWALVSNAWHLKQLGAEINHIHPFAFLLAAPQESVREILLNGNPLAKRSVIGGIIEGLERGNLVPYIPSFAREMGRDPEIIGPLIQNRSWQELINYLFCTRSEGS